MKTETNAKCPRCGALKPDWLLAMESPYLEDGSLNPEDMVCQACSEEVLARIFRHAQEGSLGPGVLE